MLGETLDDFPDILRTGAMTSNAWQSTPLRPPTVAIHDDRDMIWERPYLPDC